MCIPLAYVDLLIVYGLLAPTSIHAELFTARFEFKSGVSFHRLECHRLECEFARHVDNLHALLCKYYRPYRVRACYTSICIEQSIKQTTNRGHAQAEACLGVASVWAWPGSGRGLGLGVALAWMFLRGSSIIIIFK